MLSLHFGKNKKEKSSCCDKIRIVAVKRLNYPSSQFFFFLGLPGREFLYFITFFIFNLLVMIFLFLINLGDCLLYLFLVGCSPFFLIRTYELFKHK